MLFTATAALADHASDLLSENDGGCVHANGFEWGARWRSALALAEPSEVLWTTGTVKKAVEKLRDSW
jgi:hypothetical protein